MNVTRNSGSVIGRLLAVTAILVGMLMVTAIFAVRTTVGQQMIEARLSAHVGLPVVIARARIGWPYALVIEQMRSVDFAEGAPGIEAQELRIGLSPWGGMAVSLRRAHARMKRHPDGIWEPGYFARAAEAAEADPTLMARIGDRMGARDTLRLAASSMTWRADDGISNAAFLRGIDYAMSPVRMPGRFMRHHRLGVESRLGVDGRRGSDLAYEWLSGDGAAYIDLTGTERAR